MTTTSTGRRAPLSDDSTLIEWFLHRKLALGVIGTERSGRIPWHPGGSSIAQAANDAALTEAVWEVISRQKVPSGVALIASGEIKVGDLVWFEDDVWFKDVARAYEAGDDPEGAKFHWKVDVGRNVKVAGHFNASHLTSTTSLSVLTRRETVFILGYVTRVTDTDVGLRPVIIAHRGKRHHAGFVDTNRRIWPEQVDQFEGVDFSSKPSRSELNLLRHFSEADTKKALLEILGDPDEDKDWGGEQFDIWTDRVTVDGVRFQSAFLLKGPAKFHPMKIADLGKNGDQISRLADTEAGLLVVQHCHRITAPVAKMLSVYAQQPGYGRRYMLIDGYYTVRILQHFKKL